MIQRIKKVAILTSILASTFISSHAFSETIMSDDDVLFLNMINEKLGSNATSAYSVRKSRFPELYEVSLTNGSTIIIDENGEYGVVGGRGGAEIFNFSKGESITKKEKGRLALDYVNNNAPLVTYKAKREDAEIFIFADIQCGYCQMLHDSVPELNASGITVKYYPVPMFENSDLIMNAAFCSEEPEMAYSRFSNGIRNSKRNVSEQAKAQNLSRKEYDSLMESAMSRIVRSAKKTISNSDCAPYDMKNAELHAKGLGVLGTPNILFSSGIKVEAAMSVSEIQKLAFEGK